MRDCSIHNGTPLWVCRLISRMGRHYATELFRVRKGCSGSKRHCSSRGLILVSPSPTWPDRARQDRIGAVPEGERSQSRPLPGVCMPPLGCYSRRFPSPWLM